MEVIEEEPTMKSALEALKMELRVQRERAVVIAAEIVYEQLCGDGEPDLELLGGAVSALQCDDPVQLLLRAVEDLRSLRVIHQTLGPRLDMAHRSNDELRQRLARANEEVLLLRGGKARRYGEGGIARVRNNPEYFRETLSTCINKLGPVDALGWLLKVVDEIAGANEAAEDDPPPLPPSEVE